MDARIQLAGGYMTATRHSTTYDYISPLNLNLAGKHVLITGTAWETGQPPLRALGRLDVLVNNAAHQEPPKPLLDADPAVYWRTWEVNVGGLINMTCAFLPMLLSTRGGGSSSGGGGGGLCTIINVASSGALSARPGGASYRSSKLAVLRWTETLQLEYGDQGLLTFCVNPGAIKTKITEGNLLESVRNSFPDRPEVAGDTVAWLAAERREWLGGRYVSCPWDMEELLAKKDEIVEKDMLKIRMVF